MVLQSINPSTGEIIANYEETSGSQIENLIENSQKAFTSWRKTTFAVRGTYLYRAAERLDQKAEEFARLMACEMGKPIREGIAEIHKCALTCRYYAEHAESLFLRQTAETDASKSFVTFNPLGIILAVMPWNFPFWQVFRFAAPNLMAGNTAILKHASNVSGCALAIESVFNDAGLPSSVFTTLLISSQQVASIIENPLIRAVTLTGSTPAGQAVARKAGECLKKTVLELGGSDPYIILDDADLELAATACVTSRLINTGQTCISAKRFICVEKVYDQFEKLFVEKMSQIRYGDPLLPETHIGPMARLDLRDELHTQVCKSIECGAELLLGGTMPESKGAFYPPTVLSNVKKGMPVYDEETFGPVAALINVSDEEEAIRVANDTVFGLGAAIFTRDTAKAERIAADELEAGSCFINTFVKSDPRLPFGGIKQSGFGRELTAFGIHEFVNIKSVFIK